MKSSSLKNAVQRSVQRAGFELTAKWRLPTLSHTRRLQDLFHRFAISAVIDVGANAGQFRDQMRREVGFAGPIHSFEPDPALAAKLVQRAATDPAWTIYPVALGFEAGTMALNVMRDPVYNSFNAPLAERAAGHAHGSTVVQTVDVEMKTLDALAHLFPDLAHTYLKVDTQGFDLEVIKGGREVVSQVPALQIEVPMKPLYVGSPSMETSLATMRDLGFAVADMFLVSTDGDHRAVEFDCVMIRDIEPQAPGARPQQPPAGVS